MCHHPFIMRLIGPIERFCAVSLMHGIIWMPINGEPQPTEKHGQLATIKERTVASDEKYSNKKEVDRKRKTIAQATNILRRRIFRNFDSSFKRNFHDGPSTGLQLDRKEKIQSTVCLKELHFAKKTLLASASQEL